MYGYGRGGSLVHIGYDTSGWHMPGFGYQTRKTERIEQGFKYVVRQ